MKTLTITLLFALLAGCASVLPEKSPTKLEKSPCACGDFVGFHHA